MSLKLGFFFKYPNSSVSLIANFNKSTHRYKMWHSFFPNMTTQWLQTQKGPIKKQLLLCGRAGFFKRPVFGNLSRQSLYLKKNVTLMLPNLGLLWILIKFLFFSVKSVPAPSQTPISSRRTCSSIKVTNIRSHWPPRDAKPLLIGCWVIQLSFHWPLWDLSLLPIILRIPIKLSPHWLLVNS